MQSIDVPSLSKGGAPTPVCATGEILPAKKLSRPLQKIPYYVAPRRQRSLSDWSRQSRKSSSCSITSFQEEEHIADLLCQVLDRLAPMGGRMRFVVVLWMAVILAGWSPSQATKLADCQIEADRFFPTFRPLDTDDPRSQYIIECMEFEGLRFGRFAERLR